jgi:hypothetical protein
MEDPSFPFLILAEAVREQPFGSAIHDDVFPLPTLYLVNRRKVHGRPIGGSPSERAAKPGLEAGDVRVERRQRLESQKVIGVRGSVRLPPG